MKSSFRKIEIDYLGYVVTRKGIKLQQKKVEVVLKITGPKTVKEVRRFLGMVQYYRDLWQKRRVLQKKLSKYKIPAGERYDTITQKFQKKCFTYGFERPTARSDYSARRTTDCLLQSKIKFGPT